jgi:murein DD-endopeptidase MepM/ murein hydrolase activator NlpD
LIKSKITTKNTYIQILGVSLFVIFIFISNPLNTLSQSADDIKSKIEEQGDKIKQLEEEIKVYEKQIQTTSGEAKNLQNAIKVLDTNQKKVSTEIQKTETTINRTNLTINKLLDDVDVLEEKIDNNTLAIAQILKSMYQSEQYSLIENILANKSIADVMDNYESIREFQTSVRERTDELSKNKTVLEETKNQKEKEKGKLLSLKSELGDQKIILDNNKKEKGSLLSETKNKEAEYKKMLAEKQAQKEAFEKQLFEYESQLKRIVDPNSFPSAQSGVINWPLDNIFITQYFGKTKDAKRLYSSGTHNGIDFRASRGTPVKSVLEGVVKGVGNTDSQKGCYSYGKWVLIEHPNGLSSMYAHLDLIKVAPGEQVGSGSVIGYSGQTGYATGPHLHFTLYASQGVEIERYSFSKNCKNTSIPIADQTAYLDPMEYFKK